MIDSGLVHPMRFQRSRPFSRKLFQVYDRTVGRGEFITMDAVRAIHGLVIEAFNAQPDARRAQAVRACGGDLTGVVTQEGSLSAHVARFRAHGRNVFLLEPSLLALLGRTDLDGVSLGDLRFPFAAFYVAFGDAFEGGLPGAPSRIDGAYVWASGGLIEVVVTSRRLDVATEAKSWPANRDRYFYFPLDLAEGAGEPLSAAVDRAVRRGGIPLRPRPIDGPSLSSIVAGATGMEPSRIVDRRNQTAQSDAAFAQGGYEPACRALAIVANALCWLTACREGPQATEAAWPADAPADLLDMAASSRPALRQRGRSELVKQGYSQIVICRGGEVPATRTDRRSEGATQVAPHWRRGHWRRQPCGLGRSEVRLVWLRPTFVGGEPKPDANNGHLYRMKSSE